MNGVAMFLAGFIFGGTGGVFAMALMSADGRADDATERAATIGGIDDKLVGISDWYFDNLTEVSHGYKADEDGGYWVEVGSDDIEKLNGLICDAQNLMRKVVTP